MNINKFTTKSQEAIQLSQQIAQGLGQQQIENEHLFKALLEVDEKIKRECGAFQTNLGKYHSKFPKSYGWRYYVVQNG
mgnify:CR=1 FL=1